MYIYSWGVVQVDNYVPLQIRNVFNNSESFSFEIILPSTCQGFCPHFRPHLQISLFDTIVIMQEASNLKTGVPFSQPKIARHTYQKSYRHILNVCPFCPKTMVKRLRLRFRMTVFPTCTPFTSWWTTPGTVLAGKGNQLKAINLCYGKDATGISSGGGTANEVTSRPVEVMQQQQQVTISFDWLMRCVDRATTYIAGLPAREK